LDGRAFVAADADILAREELEDLVEDLEDEPQGGFLGVEDTLVDAPASDDLGSCRVAGRVGIAEFGVSGDGGAGMSGNVDLWDDGDVPLGRVGDDFADVVLGVVTAVRGAGRRSGSPAATRRPP
jgi:hypothetical protein